MSLNECSEDNCFLGQLSKTVISYNEWHEENGLLNKFSHLCTPDITFSGEQLIKSITKLDQVSTTLKFCIFIMCRINHDILKKFMNLA